MTNKNYYHYIFLAIISINYIFPYIVFGSITTFYHDNLDSIIVYNKIIGEIYREGFNFNQVKIFLAGELKFYFLRHIFKPFIFCLLFFKSRNGLLDYRLIIQDYKLLVFLLFIKKNTK